MNKYEMRFVLFALFSVWKLNFSFRFYFAKFIGNLHEAVFS